MEEKNMNFTDEMIARAKTAASAAELQAMAKEYNIELTDTDAAEYFDFLNGNRKVNENGLQELSSVELAMVAGGKGKDPDPKYAVGTHLWLGYFTTQNYLEVVVVAPEFYSKEDNSWRYLVNPVGYDFNQNEYLESRKYVHTSNPGPGWHD